MSFKVGCDCLDCAIERRRMGYEFVDGRMFGYCKTYDETVSLAVDIDINEVQPWWLRMERASG